MPFGVLGMSKFYYDLHIHSCLSPCGDEDNTPNNIAGMAALCEIDIVALTDHNTARNCPAFFKAAEKHGIVAVAGMELTTSEDIHVVCLFEKLDDAMEFDRYVDGLRFKIKNKPEIFGEQLLLDGDDEVIGREEYLLTNATALSIDELPEAVSRFGGICFPAHIDRLSNGIVGILGALPPTPDFQVVELNSRDKLTEYTEKFGLSDKRVLISSDAHYLTDMRDKENFLELDAPRSDPDAVRRELFKYLGGQDEGNIS